MGHILKSKSLKKKTKSSASPAKLLANIKSCKKFRDKRIIIKQVARIA